MTIIVKKFDKTLFCDSYNNYIRNLLTHFKTIITSLRTSIKPQRFEILSTRTFVHQ